MFESNFPVDKVSCSYNNMWNAFKRIVRSNGLDQHDTDLVFWKTAASVYSIAVPGFDVGSGGGGGSTWSGEKGDSTMGGLNKTAGIMTATL